MRHSSWPHHIRHPPRGAGVRGEAARPAGLSWGHLGPLLPSRGIWLTLQMLEEAQEIRLVSVGQSLLEDSFCSFQVYGQCLPTSQGNLALEGPALCVSAPGECTSGLCECVCECVHAHKICVLLCTLMWVEHVPAGVARSVACLPEAWALDPPPGGSRG